MIYVSLPESFRAQATKFGLLSDTEELVRRIESDEGYVRCFDHIQPYFKKRLRDKHRLVGRLLSVGEERVLVFLWVFHRNTNEYEEFLQHTEEFGESRWGDLLKTLRDTLPAWTANRRREGANEAGRPPLPPEYRGWFEPPGWDAGDSEELVVYETPGWISGIAAVPVQLQSRYYDLVRAVADGEEGEPVRESPPLRRLSDGPRAILFARVTAAGDSTRKLILLVGNGEGSGTAQAQELVSVLETLRSVPVPWDRLAASAAKAYPAYLLAEERAWYAIENDSESNLALSPEEERLLDRLSRPTAAAPAQPVFINGRAGSGKSTMLAYLFADYCHRWLTQGVRDGELAGSPIFIAYSTRLLETTSERVRRLLDSHARFLGSGATTNALSRGEDALRGAFREFRTLLFELLPANERDRFDPAFHVGYSRFRRLYGEPGSEAASQSENAPASLTLDRRNACKLRERRDISPELAWHVIRAYIKGRRFDEAGSDAILSPEEYEEVPRRERSVEPGVFASVFKSIWDRWYRPLTTEGGYWDDQDLIRATLPFLPDDPKYTAIFCDEAQDFTPLEFELIMRLSRLTRYDLGFTPPRSLPFGFAGDPLQTINPTGFRWAAVGAAFHDTVVRSVDPGDRWNLKVRPHELTLNYRSTPAIVKVGNTIQLWRTALFGIDDLKPQHPWRAEGGIEPCRFLLDVNLEVADFVSAARDTVIIVPCEEGEEAEFARNDPVLRRFTNPETPGEAPRNVLSASAAKGLEFDRVVIYKFGEACPSLEWAASPDDQPLSAQYFFNKLYVAVSRARKRLFVVDSEQGNAKLWRHCAESSDVTGWVERLGDDGGQWVEHVAAVPMAAKRAFTELQEQNPLANAEELETKGHQFQSAELLRRAAQYFDNAEQRPRADLCRAWACRFEAKFREAGEIFLQLGKHEDARACFWDGECWSDLLAWYAKRETEPDASRYIGLARFMTDRSREGGVRAFGGILRDTAALTSSGQVDPNAPQWRHALETYQDRLRALDTADLQASDWRAAAEVLETWPGPRQAAASAQAGQCYFRAGDHADALRCWERTGGTRHHEYFRAKAAIATDIADKIKWLMEARDDAAILALWESESAPDAPLPPALARAVLPLLEERDRYGEVIELQLGLGDTAAALSALASLRKKAKPADYAATAMRVLQDLLQRDHFPEAADLVDKARRYKGALGSQVIPLEVALVRAFARSGRTAKTVTPAVLRSLGELVDELLGSNWRKHLELEEMASAIERLGKHLLALQFYEALEGDQSAPANERTFARQRWLVSKRRQVLYFRSEKKEEDAKRAEKTLLSKAKSWRMKATMALPEYPLTAAVAAPVSGLPDSARLVQDTAGWWEFLLEGCHVRFHPSRGRLIVTEQRSGDRLLLFDVESSELKSDRELAVSHREGRTEFRLAASDLGGALVPADPGRVELRIRGAIVTIRLEAS